MDKGSLEIRDDKGHIVSIEILSVKDEEPVLEQLIDRPMYFKMRRYHIFMAVNDLPGLSINTYHVFPVQGNIQEKQKYNR